jgi:hypothetical protein
VSWRSGVVVLACGVAVGCSTAPKGDSFAGSWQASGGVLSGDTIVAGQPTSDSLCGFIVLSGGSISPEFYGSNVGGQVEFLAQSQQGVLGEFDGHFVSSTVVAGSLAGQTVTLTRLPGTPLITGIDSGAIGSYCE